MSDSPLQQLTSELMAYWQREFDEYIRAGGLPALSAERNVARVVRQLLAIQSYDSAEARKCAAAQVHTFTGASITKFQPRTVLLAASESGAWASELTVVASMLLTAGYDVVVATETGRPPHLLSVSCDAEFIDGPLGIRVVSPEEAELARRFLDPGTPEGALLRPEAIANLNELIRPPLVADYLKDPQATMRQFSEGMSLVHRWANKYDALVIAGGSGAVAGFSMNGGLHHLILALHRLRRPIVAQCNGVFALVQAIDPATGRSILAGRLATTHSKTHEYRRGGWGWARKDGAGLEAWTLPGADGNPIIDSEPLVRNAVGPHGDFLSPPATPYCVAMDGHIITARTTPDGAPATAALLAMLDGDTPLTGRQFITHERFEPRS
jgi:putative intracellular protease/amidase